VRRSCSVSPLDELEDQVELAVSDDREDLRQIGMRELSRELGLLQELLADRRRFVRVLVEVLDGHGALEHDVGRLVHDADAPARELALDAEIAAEHRARSERPGRRRRQGLVGDRLDRRLPVLVEDALAALEDEREGRQSEEEPQHVLHRDRARQTTVRRVRAHLAQAGERVVDERPEGRVERRRALILLDRLGDEAGLLERHGVIQAAHRVVGLEREPRLDVGQRLRDLPELELGEAFLE